METQKFNSNQIVLVNDMNMDRCRLSGLIDSISMGSPKVIGLNLVLEGENGDACDSLLSSSINRSGRVVLTEYVIDDKRIRSADVFYNPSLQSGFDGLWENEGGEIDGYQRLLDLGNGWEYSFPFHIVINFVGDSASKVAEVSYPTPYPIPAIIETRDFLTLNGSKLGSVNPSVFKNKIVLVGYLGPEQLDLCKVARTGTNSDSTYSTLLIAGIILDVLNDPKIQYE